MKLPSAVDKVAPSQVVHGADDWTMYDMPDIKGGTIRVNFGGAIPDDKNKDGPVVKQITFLGQKPGIE